MQRKQLEVGGAVSGRKEQELDGWVPWSSQIVCCYWALEGRFSLFALFGLCFQPGFREAESFWDLDTAEAAACGRGCVTIPFEGLSFPHTLAQPSRTQGTWLPS